MAVAHEDVARPDAGPPGVLNVRAVPWGIVWIDGLRVGAGRVRREVPAGPHEVAVGVNRPTARRSVTVAPGERCDQQTDEWLARDMHGKEARRIGSSTE